MPDDHQFTLRQIDGTRGDLSGIADEIEVLKKQIAQLPSRAYVSRLALMATELSRKAARMIAEAKQPAITNLVRLRDVRRGGALRTEPR